MANVGNLRFKIKKYKPNSQKGEVDYVEKYSTKTKSSRKGKTVSNGKDARRLRYKLFLRPSSWSLSWFP